MSYIDWDKVAGDGTTPTDDEKAIVEQQVGLFLEANFGQDFLSHTVETTDPELHVIGSNQDYIIAKNFPIISVTELKDDIVNNTTPTTLTEDTNFVVRKKSGLITLTQPADSIDNLDNFGENFYFTKGVNNVSLAYVYGFETLPSDIQALANMMASVTIKMINKSSTGGDFSEIEMGDYRKKVSQGNINTSAAFYENPVIKMMMPGLKSKYYNPVSLGTQAED